MLLKVLTGIIVIILASNKIYELIESRKDNVWMKWKRGDLICTFTDYKFLEEEEKVEIYGTIIEKREGITLPCRSIEIIYSEEASVQESCLFLKYYRTLSTRDLIEMELVNHYPLNVPFNCTIDYSCKKFRLLNIPPGFSLLKLDNSFKFMLLFLIFVTLIIHCIFPTVHTLYLVMVLSILYLMRSYHQHMIISSPYFTFQFFSNGQVVEL